MLPCRVQLKAASLLWGNLAIWHCFSRTLQGSVKCVAGGAVAPVPTVSAAPGGAAALAAYIMTGGPVPPPANSLLPAGLGRDSATSHGACGRHCCAPWTAQGRGRPCSQVCMAQTYRLTPSIGSGMLAHALRPVAKLHHLLLCRLQVATAALLLPTSAAAGPCLLWQRVHPWWLRTSAALRSWSLVPPVLLLPPPQQCRPLQKVLLWRYVNRSSTARQLWVV